MFPAISIIHIVFLAILFLFGRYIEMSGLFLVWVIFALKMFPPFHTQAHESPIILSEKTKKNDNQFFEKTLYFSSGLLFYTALVSIALGVANILWLPVDLQLLYYCVLFLTGIIYWLYILYYPSNPNISTVFQIHTMIASTVLSVALLYEVFFGKGSISMWLLINLVIFLIGYWAIIILSRNISYRLHIKALYFSLTTFAATLLWWFLYFDISMHSAIFIIILCLFLGYVVFPFFIQKMYHTDRSQQIYWHYTNSILATSWIVFLFQIYLLFLNNNQQIIYILLSLLLLFIFWLLVYIHYENEIFFGWMLLVVSSFAAYTIFSILPQIFWISAAAIYVFWWALMFASRSFKTRNEELILAGWSIVFLCFCDIILIMWLYNNLNNPLSVALFFFFQSLIWNIAYGIFHRHANVQNQSL